MEREARRASAARDLGQAAGLRWIRGHAGSIAHGIATTPVNRELAEGRRAVALPLVVMDLLFFAELLVTKMSLPRGRTRNLRHRPEPDLEPGCPGSRIGSLWTLGSGSPSGDFHWMRSGRWRQGQQLLVHLHHRHGVSLAVLQQLPPQRLPVRRRDGISPEEQRLQHRGGSRALADVEVARIPGAARVPARRTSG